MVVADLNAEGAKESVAQAKAVAINPDFQAEAIEVDVASKDSVKAAVAQTVQLFGRIDYAIHSAGVSSPPNVIGFESCNLLRFLVVTIDPRRHF